MIVYVIVYLYDVDMCDDIVEYFEWIDGMFVLYDGYFVIYGVCLEVCEGEWCGDLIVIVFFDFDMVCVWYELDVYWQIQLLCV